MWLKLSVLKFWKLLIEAYVAYWIFICCRPFQLAFSRTFCVIFRETFFEPYVKYHGKARNTFEILFSLAKCFYFWWNKKSSLQPSAWTSANAVMIIGFSISWYTNQRLTIQRCRIEHKLSFFTCHEQTWEVGSGKKQTTPHKKVKRLRWISRIRSDSFPLIPC